MYGLSRQRVTMMSRSFLMNRGTLPPEARYFLTLRKSLGLSQESFAEEIGISPRQLARIEAGEHRMKVQTLFDAMNRFDVPTSHLMLMAYSETPSGIVEIAATHWATRRIDIATTFHR